jgi:hypothetical protein
MTTAKRSYFEPRAFFRWLSAFFGFDRSKRAMPSSGGSSILSTSGCGPGLDLGCGTVTSVAKPADEELTPAMVRAGAEFLASWGPLGGCMSEEGPEEAAVKVYRLMLEARDLPPSTS